MTRILLVKWLAVAGLAGGLWAARRAWWMAQRTCPRAPLNERWRHLGGPPPALVGGLLLWTALTPPNAILTLALSALLALGCAKDWTRMRPWLYQNTVLLLALAFNPPQVALQTARVIVVSVYFWSGLLKINRVFPTAMYPFLCGPLCSRLPATFGAVIRRLGWFAPLIETSLALGLLFPKWRPLALLGVLAMHALILAMFSPWGHRSHREIWPWNLTMAATSLVLFAATGDLNASEMFLHPSPFHLLVVGLFTLLPLGGVANRLDPVFTHGHMAGRHVLATLALSPHFKARLPEKMQRLCQRFLWGRRHVFLLEIYAWYQGELHLPPPQQARLLRDIAVRFAKDYDAQPADLSLIVTDMPGWRDAEGARTIYSGSELLAKKAP